MREFRKGVFLFAFFSGISALIYELVWIRAFALLFGSTTLSVSAIVSAFFAGLALGSWLFGRGSDRSSNLLKLYAVIEIAIAVSSVLATFSPRVLFPLLALTQRNLEGNYILLAFARFLISFSVLLVPSALIGGTFPVLARFFVRASFPGKDLGSLYAVNTAGGMFGVFLSGFILIGYIGVLESAIFASIINLSIGVCSLILSGRVSLSRGMRVSQKAVGIGDARKERPGTQHGTIIPIALAVSGFCALGYEVLWTRALSHFAGVTSYAFTIMLFTFLLGIVMGSFLISRFLEGKRNLSTLSTFGAIEILIGVSAFLFTHLLSVLVFLVPSGRGESWLGWLSSRFALSSLSLLIPTALLGATFPLATKLGSSVSSQFGRSVGFLYAINTLGAIIGSVATGFILIQFLGTERSFLILGALSGGIGVVMLAMEKKRVSSFVRVSFISLILVSFLFSLLVPSNLFKTAFRNKVSGRLVYFAERSDAAVEVMEEESPSLPPWKRLYINGTSNTGTSFQSRRYMKLQALIPALLHRNPEDILVMCFGTGITLGASVISPDVKTAHCVEISKAVLDAGYIFREENGDVLKNRKVKVFIGDGRNFVALGNRKYDIITAEPSPPTDAGSVNLYSTEFYEACKRSLKPGGIVAQWIPFHTQSEKQTKMLIKSCISVFQNSLLFMTDRLETLILGSLSPFSIDFSLLKERFESMELKEPLREIGITSPYSLLGCFLMDGASLQEFSRGQTEISDNHPRIEFFIPLNPVAPIPPKEALSQVMENLMSGRPDLGELSAIVKFATEADEESVKVAYRAMEHFMQGEIFQMEGNPEMAIGGYSAALHLDPKNEYFRFPLGISSEHEEFLLGRLSQNEGDTPSRIQLGMLYLRRNETQRGLEELTKAVSLDPENPEAHYGYALGLAGSGDRGGAVRELEISRRLSRGNLELQGRIDNILKALR